MHTSIRTYTYESMSGFFIFWSSSLDVAGGCVLGEGVDAME